MYVSTVRREVQTVLTITFEANCAKIGATQLWQLLKEKAENENLTAAFMEAVGKVCEHGVTLSKTIMEFFPTFTLHDEVHIANVCNWMTRLLGEHAEKLNAKTVAMLLMAACCHDVGMCVSTEEKESLLEDSAESAEWMEYRKKHLRDDEEISKTGKITEEILRRFIRIHHHERLDILLTDDVWSEELGGNGLLLDNLIALCKSHGEPIKRFDPQWNNGVDPHLCAALLRLADILDFDASRAPAVLFEHFGLDHSIDLEEQDARTEWAKNRAGVFGKAAEGVLPFIASFESLQLEYEVRSYLDWVKEELNESADYLKKYAGLGQELVLPHRISTDNVNRRGYHFGNFCLTMDQDRVMELLTGRNLYSDPGVFVRELLQNAIDAVRTRVQLDPSFDPNDGKITIRTWMDAEGYSWFRIEDNGTGMDEHIIENYFLRVGRSYYTSDEFKADKRNAPSYGRTDDYTAISRFGIGILSCFMSDPEHNLLEVSTKRYAKDRTRPEKAIRLNVTGLHGYYYMAKEGEQRAVGNRFKPLHNPENKKEGYRTESGTTICVRTRMDQLGDYRSFKEIVDQYVQFPEVRVVYEGQEDSEEYPTQAELMEAVHELNPDGPDKPLKEYFHPISEEQFAKLKKAIPDATWKGTPGLVIRYQPLDWLSGSKALVGVSVRVESWAKASLPQCDYHGISYAPALGAKIEYNDLRKEFRLKFGVDFKRGVERKFELIIKIARDAFVGEEYARHENDADWLTAMARRYDSDMATVKMALSEREAFANLSKRERMVSGEEFYSMGGTWRTYCTFTIPYHELLGMADTEKRALGFAVETRKRTHSRKNYVTRDVENSVMIAYNGVLADASNSLEKVVGLKSIRMTAILLYGDYCPEVDLARTVVSRMPLEAACNLALVWNEIDTSCIDVPEWLSARPFALLPELEWREMLAKHPAWMEQVRFRDHTFADLQKMTADKVEVASFYIDFIYSILCLAALKLRFSVYKDTAKDGNPYITGESADNKLLDFPPTLFFKSPEEGGPLVYTVSFVARMFRYYNQDHHFSQWLIKNGKELREQVPGIYNHLLKIMILERNKDELRLRVNGLLDRLRMYNNNHFHVSDELRLKESDFAGD